MFIFISNCPLVYISYFTKITEITELAKKEWKSIKGLLKYRYILEIIIELNHNCIAILFPNIHLFLYKNDYSKIYSQKSQQTFQNLEIIQLIHFKYKIFCNERKTNKNTHSIEW